MNRVEPDVPVGLVWPSARKPDEDVGFHRAAAAA